MTARLPLVLVILDGWGIAPAGPGNAITQAHPATYESLVATARMATLRASGQAVGLPAKQVGNSEAGHMNIGAGRVVQQDAVRINKEIANGLFYRNPAFTQALAHCRSRKSRLHLVGLLTGIESGHAFPSHLLALLKFVQKSADIPVLLHLFSDGRDTAKYAAVELLHGLEKKIGPSSRIATIAGRFWGMDRAKRWSRTEQAYLAMTSARGRRAKSAEHAVLDAYKRGESDEFITPTVIGSAVETRAGCVRDNDAMILFNLRSDRARQITKAFVQPQFEKFNPGAFRRVKTYKKLFFVAMTDFGPDLPNIITAYPSVNLDDTLVHALGDLRQVYIAETEKFAHVTFFFNGGHAAPVIGEQRVMVPSYNVESFDKTPEMSTPEIARRIVKAVTGDTADVIVANLANADMVGHTGNLAAGVAAVQSIDRALAAIIPAALAKNGTVVITGDHGNIEAMVNQKSGEVDTEHNVSPVPLLLVGKRLPQLAPRGVLADIAPTILRLLGRTPPNTMTGRSLLRP
ncbi:MAG: 2,3-bisphosphoglycerate-independent phosphoglycerate mutase [Candidatus Kerfeldbacteria bacterium]|nr:2,3-bisphosphoglycerate-independent phosphoglycerate mutase [Candidatus Kerfeldbacteria bacterium]